MRYAYSSLTTPTTVYDYDVRTGEKTLLKRDPVMGSFDPANYRTEFLFAPARDGKRIPVSLVYRKGFARDGTAPLLQYAYGAYGLSVDPCFSSARLSLLDRGFVLRHRPCARRPGNGPRLVRRRAIARTRRIRSPTSSTSRTIWSPERYARQGQGLCHGRQRRRAARWPQSRT